jgi:hypothetical protein
VTTKGIGLVLGRRFVTAVSQDERFADFDSDTYASYEDRVIHQITDADKWKIEDFKSIYEPKTNPHRLRTPAATG